MDAGEHYGPRQTATYDVLVTDHDGQPVEAELSLRLADLAVLALADETGPTLMEHFGAAGAWRQDQHARWWCRWRRTIGN